MNRISFILIACLVLMVLTVGLAAAATIEVRADLWSPYTNEPKSARPGYVVELLQTIFGAQGHEIHYQLSPWPRALADVREGRVAAALGTDQEESPDFVFPAEPCGTNQNGFFAKVGSDWRFAGIESLKSVRLGVIQGYGYYTDLDDYLAASTPKGKVYKATGDAPLRTLIKMLEAGRIDVLVENVNVMSTRLQELHLAETITNVGLSEVNYPIYVGFSPAKDSSRDYGRIYDAGIGALRQSGRLQEILSRYGLNDWK